MVDSTDGWRNTYLYYEACAMPMTVRLNARTERAVNALARRRRQTRSDVVRDALEHYTATNGGDASRGRPYDAWLDVIGVVSAGARDRGRTTGEQFTAIVREKARARRAR
jgi:Arc/MetJ-type ribon-helix-helix transcriptional regulator